MSIVITTPGMHLPKTKKNTFKLAVILAACFALLAPFGLVVLRSANKAQAAPGDYSFAGTIGTKGSIAAPYGVTTAPDGSLYVSDGSDNTGIAHLSADGTILGRFGSYGQGQGQFASPAGMTFDAGHLYVADTSNNRVLKMTADGDFVSQFGSGVYGYGIGEFANPYDVSVDDDGNVYLVGGGFISGVGSRYGVKKFDANGNEINSWIYGNGAFNNPRGIVVVHDEMYIADTYSGRVQVHSAIDGSFLRGWYGSGENQLALPWGIDVDSAGNIVVSETGNVRVQIFTPTGGSVAIFGNEAGPNKLQSSGFLSVDSADNKYVVDEAMSLVRKYDASNNYVTSFSIQQSRADALYYPRVMANDAAGNIYVYNGDVGASGLEQGQRLITVFAKDGSVVERRIIQAQYLSDDGSQGYYFEPYYGMFVESNGDIYLVGSGFVYDNVSGESKSYGVAKYTVGSDQPVFMFESYTDEYNASPNSIFRDSQTGKLTLSGNFSTQDSPVPYALATIDNDGANPQFFAERNFDDGVGENYWYLDARMAALGADGNYYFAGYYQEAVNGEFESYAVYKYNPTTGKFTGLVPSDRTSGSINTQVSSGSVSVGADGSVYVFGEMSEYDSETATSVQYAIAKYSPTGEFVSWIARSGTDEESWVQATSETGRLVVDKFGNVFALDANVGVIKKFIIEAALPSQPLNVVAKNETTSSIDVSWAAPADDGSASIVSYRVAYRVAGATTWQSVVVNGSTLNRVVDGLTPNTNYEFQVFVTNSVGESIGSNIATAKTLAENVVPTPPNPDVPLAPNTGRR